MLGQSYKFTPSIKQSRNCGSATYLSSFFNLSDSYDWQKDWPGVSLKASCTYEYAVSWLMTTVCKYLKSMFHWCLKHYLGALPSSYHSHHLALIIPLKFCLKAPSLLRTCCSLWEENINRSLALLLWFNWGVIERLRLKNWLLVLLGKIISVWFAQPLCFAAGQI